MKLKLSIYNLFRGLIVRLRVILFILRGVFSWSDKVFFLEWEIIKVTSLDFSIGILLDWISLSFLGTVRLISGSILYYCNYYIIREKNYLRFTFIMIIFVGSIWFLIIRPNLVSILLGWDGLGLSSYALVIFYQNESSRNAGILTILRNRIGDVAIILGVRIISLNGRFNFIFLDNCTVFMGSLIILAAITKRAQIPFSAWLPAAIAAPTPVSSLVHSSTLVTAGVYLLIRFSRIINRPILFNIIFFVGLITMFISGLGANFERDLKKVVALSTLSQLGLIFRVLGIGKPSLAFFHLLTHALFKSRIFICVGFIIHSRGGSQDSRHISSFFNSSPFLGLGLRITNLALRGFPFLAGFYSKDIILEIISTGLLNKFSMLLLILSTSFTVCYRIRLVIKGLCSIRNLNSLRGLGDIDTTVMKRIGFLLGISTIGGYLIGRAFFFCIEVRVLSSLIKFWVVSCLLFSILLMTIYLSFSIKYIPFFLVRCYYYFSQMWFLPKLSSNSVSLFFLRQGSFNIKLGEYGWLEKYGGQGSKEIFFLFRRMFQISQKRIIISSYLFRGIMVVIYIIF